MTLKELSQLYHLNREIEIDRRRLEELEQDQDATQEEVRYLRDIIEAKHRHCLYERIRIERYIAKVEDSLLRQIFTYRFVNGLPWRQVAACVGGSNTEDSVRMLCKRYILLNSKRTPKNY